jgi:hypothetical protein
MSITIKHLHGPLKGDQPFDDKYPSVVFGRDPEACQVVYPPEYDVVGKKHFELKRGKAGDYTVGLFGKRYVEIDGKQADEDAPVVSGNVLRLGRKDGPAFSVEIAKPVATGLKDTGEQAKVITPVERERDLRRKLLVAGGAVVAALCLVAGVLYANHLRTSRIDYQLESMADAAAKNAE